MEMREEKIHSIFGGQPLRYRDPMSYASGSLNQLIHGTDDIVWVERQMEPYGDDLLSPAFHDFVERPVCEHDYLARPLVRSAAFILARSDVVLTGYRTLVGQRDLEYNLDEAFVSAEAMASELSVLGRDEQWASELTGFKPTHESFVYKLDESHRRVISINEPVICLTSDEAPNYGSFLFRILPKLVQVALLDVSIKILVPVYFHSLRQFLMLAGIDESRLIHQDLVALYKLKRAILPSMRNSHAWLDRESIAFYDSLRMRHGESRRDRKIYLSRRDYLKSHDGQGRIMLNESELIEKLKERGFEVVEPQNFSALQQIRMFSSASLIVSASGSALFNIVFSYPGTKVIDIESEPHWISNHARLFGSRGLDFGIFEGTPSDYTFKHHHVPFEVDVSRLMDRIDNFK